MFEYYDVYLDGINDYDEWMSYEVDESDLYSNFQAMIEDIKCALREMGGGHADIYSESGAFVFDVEV